eukprot:m.474742 g.474742  ORF g.474742 m.474742 type:complete len:191 (-) comp36863_c0_seq1:837-1409(-)
MAAPFSNQSEGNVDSSREHALVLDAAATTVRCEAHSKKDLPPPVSRQRLHVTVITKPTGFFPYAGRATGTFTKCHDITSVDLADDVQQVHDAAFSGCARLDSVTYNAQLRCIGKNAFSDCPKLTTVDLSACEEISIWRAAFRDCVSLERLTLPDGTHRIDAFAFSGCARLAEIHLPDALTSMRSRSAHRL